MKITILVENEADKKALLKESEDLDLYVKDEFGHLCYPILSRLYDFPDCIVTEKSLVIS